MKIKIIHIEQLQAYCELWEQGIGDEVRGLYIAKDDGLYIAVDSSRKNKIDPYWLEEFTNQHGALLWLREG